MEPQVLPDTVHGNRMQGYQRGHIDFFSRSEHGECCKRYSYRFQYYGKRQFSDTTSGSCYFEVYTQINTTGSVTFNSKGGTWGWGDTTIITNGTIYDYEGTFGFPYAGGANYTLTPVVTVHGGNIYLSPYATYSTSASTFNQLSVGAGGTFNMDGGTITIVSPEGPARTTGHDIDVTSTSILNITGGTIKLGDGVDVHTNAVGFYISNASTYPLANLIVNGGGAGRQATLLTNCTANSLTITSGSILNDSTSAFTVTGNVSNSGQVVDYTGGEVKLSGGASTHALSGNGSYKNLELNDAHGASLSGNPTVTGALTLTAGTFTVGPNTLTLQNPILGTPTNLTGGSSSSLVFNGSASGLNIPSSVTALNNFTLNNASGSTLQGQLAINGALTISNGVLTTGLADTVTLGSTATLSEAGNGNIVLGNVQTTRTVSGNAPLAIKGKTPKSTLADQTFGGIGFEIDPAGGTTPGLTTVKRTTGIPSRRSIITFSVTTM